MHRSSLESKGRGISPSIAADQLLSREWSWSSSSIPLEGGHHHLGGRPGASYQLSQSWSCPLIQTQSSSSLPLSLSQSSAWLKHYSKKHFHSQPLHHHAHCTCRNSWPSLDLIQVEHLLMASNPNLSPEFQSCSVATSSEQSSKFHNFYQILRKTSQEYETALTSQYKLSFCSLSFLISIFLSFCHLSVWRVSSL